MDNFKIFHISDIHNCFYDMRKHFKDLEIQENDVLIVSGDLTSRGTPTELENILKRFYELKKDLFQNIIVIPGNHDFGAQNNEELWREGFRNIEVEFLIDESTSINGVKVYGSPWTPFFFNWAFNYHSIDAEQIWSKIPDDTQILVTHGPPKNILDKCASGNVGCPVLMRHINERLKQLKFHLFGHIHEGYGIYDRGDIVFSNGCINDRNYRIVNKALELRYK